MSTPLRPRAQRGVLSFEPTVYGGSLQGRPLEVWLPARQPALLVIAGLHGEEPETTVALSSALRSIEPSALGCAVVLAANPDGLARGTRGNARGVELNRNFPTGDWASAPAAHHFTRAEPQDVLLSPGSQPASEPETRGLIGLVNELSPGAVVSIHAPLGCVIDPICSPLAGWLAWQGGLELRRAVPAPTPGSFDTWAREQGEALAVTLELPVISKDEAIVRFLPLLTSLLVGPMAELVAPAVADR